MDLLNNSSAAIEMLKKVNNRKDDQDRQVFDTSTANSNSDRKRRAHNEVS